MKRFLRRNKPVEIVEPETIRLYIPDDRITQFYELYDECHEHPTLSAPTYRFWKLIVELFPQTENGRWWVSHYAHPLHPAIDGHE